MNAPLPPGSESEIDPAPPYKFLSGAMSLFIAGGAGVFGLILALGVLEQRTPGGILLTGFVFFALSFPVIGIINRIAGRKREIVDRQTKQDQARYIEAEREREAMQREAREREMEARLSPFRDFGFAHHSMEKVLAKAAGKDPAGGESGFILQAIAGSLLGEGTAARGAIEHLLPSIRGQKATHNEIFSFGFSEGLIPKLQGMNAEEFRREMSRSFSTALQQLAGREGDLESGIGEFIRFEVFLVPALPREIVLVARKSRMRMEGMVHYQIMPMLDDWKTLDTESRPFSLWDQQPSGGWRETQAPYFYGGENSTITMGPRFPLDGKGERFHSTVVDLWTDKLDRGRILPVEALAGDEPLQRLLGIKVVRQIDPYRASDVYQYDRKGFVEVVGWFLDGRWEPVSVGEGEKAYLTSMLNVSAPNLLVPPHAAAFRVESSDQNKLLANFLGTDLGARRDAVFSQGGNFEIRRGPVTYESKIHTYFIRLAENASETKFCKPAPGEGDRFHDFDAYRDFPAPRPGYSPLEDKGYSSIPASDCYFRTGRDSVQLVLKVNLGSPAPGETDRGVSYSNSQLRAALRNFAKRQGIKDLEIFEKESAQGLVSRGVRSPDRENGEPDAGGSGIGGTVDESGGGGAVWVKLLDPTHADHFASGRLAGSLVASGVLPGEVEIHRIDTYGREKAGMIPVFVMPEYLSVGKFLGEGSLPEGEERRKLAARLEGRLVSFVKRCLAQRILCTDFTLEDTFFPVQAGDVAAFLEEDEPPTDRPGLFVGDFGSYRETVTFLRGGSVTREQYRPPEDLDATLRCEVESFSVYLLGLLLVEVHGLAPGRTLESVTQLRFELDETRYTERLRRELEALLGDSEEGTVDRIAAMLAYRPEARPALDQL